MNMLRRLCLLSSLLILTCSCGNLGGDTAVKGKKWDKITLDFNGPSTSESAANNPFLNYRLDVTFTHENGSMVVPGYYAADGDAAESSADTGSVWRVHFRPDQVGDWTYTTSFREGKDIAISDDTDAGKALSFDGQTGKINISANPDSEGRLRYVGKRYLQYAESGRYFLKGGCDSPENVLGFEGIDGTIRGKAEDREGEAKASEELHKFEAHLKDFKIGDPTWQGGKGKGLIGGLNYLASKGMNTLYFLTMNIDGDGKDVYPFTSYEERLRFDCSKLAQWEIVMDHMDDLGIMQHIVLQETENELMQDGGDTKYERKIYYREMIARYAHHPRLTWNMGEENGPVHWRPEGQNTAQQKAMVNYFDKHDPYGNFTVIHSHSDTPTRDKLFIPLLGEKALDGMSLQVEDRTLTHKVTRDWIDRSAKSDRQWIMALDEIGPWWRGMDPDDRKDNNQDSIRAEALWGNLMAGGSGSEWYFGAKNHSNDLTCEDWRTRDRAWGFTAHAVNFFEKHIPFIDMTGHDELLSGAESYCFAKKGETYLVYILFGGTVKLDLKEASGDYSIKWFDPRNGGDLQNGSVMNVAAGGIVDLGNAPSDSEQDWAILLRRK